MRYPLALALIALAATRSLGAEPFFETRAIFAPEDIHNHASCVTETSGGDLLATWYRGSGERKADDVVVLGSWFKRGAKAWSPRFTLADTPGYPDCNPALFAAPDRTIWLFWPTILDHRWEGALLKFAVARDDGKHDGPLPWFREGVIHMTPRAFDTAVAKAIGSLSEAEAKGEKELLNRYTERSKDELYQRLGWMPRVRPLALPSGRWLLPLYSDTFDGSIMAISDDKGATWATSAPILGFGNIQPSLVRKNDGTIVAFMRDNGRHHQIRLSSSKDDGQTWGPVTDSTLQNPGAGVDAIRLANGHWAIIYNDAQKGRNSLALSVSDDEGATWKWTRHVEKTGVEQDRFHYPSLLQTQDGLIHTTYTRRLKGEGSTIQHTAFNEEWVMQGDAPSGK
ncbi:sialidase family protein [Singulisphaera sp. PoT]|uniref:sialidase family protein n=1 Tax=Singulisphaera sp. PoT TaxID=3411797 RepID=UPI003BF4D74C